MRKPMECERCRERLRKGKYDEDTGLQVIYVAALGCWLGFYVVQVAGFECFYLGLDVIGGILMSCGFGLLAYALRLKKKRRLKRNLT